MHTYRDRSVCAGQLLQPKAAAGCVAHSASVWTLTTSSSRVSRTRWMEGRVRGARWLKHLFVRQALLLLRMKKTRTHAARSTWFCGLTKALPDAVFLQTPSSTSTSRRHRPAISRKGGGRCVRVRAATWCHVMAGGTETPTRKSGRGWRCKPRARRHRASTQSSTAAPAR